MKILQINASYKPTFVYGGPTVSVGKLCESFVYAQEERVESKKLKIESETGEVGVKIQEERVKSKELEVESRKLKVKSDARFESQQEREQRVKNKEEGPKDNQELGELTQPQPYFDSAQQDKPQITVYTTLANGDQELPYKNGEVKLVDGVEVHYFKRITKDHSHFSPAFLWHFWKTVKNYDAIHIHAWWNLVSMGAAFICVLRSKSYILSPRGTLGNYSFHNRKSGIKIFFHAVIGRFLLSKAVFQVSSKKEQDDILKIINPPPAISIIPNFVELRQAWSVKRKAFNHSRFELLYFSRIEEKKGLEFLIEACSSLSIPFHLTICGSGNSEYVNLLKNSVQQSPIAQYVTWLGNIPSEKKFDRLASYDLMVLPSFDENFANVVIESLAVGTPVLLSRNVGLADYVEHKHLGWVTKQDASEIAKQLTTIYMDEWDDLIEKSERAPRIIQRDYDEDNLRKQYLKFYAGYSGLTNKM